MDTLLRDLKYGFRVLLKSPAFTAIAVLSLALGIGANTSIFSIVNAVILRPLPYKEPERLMAVFRQVKQRNGDLQRVSYWSYPKFEALRDQNDVFDQVAAYAQYAYVITGTDKPERVITEFVSASYFPMLGINPVVGRTFVADEDSTPGAHPVVLLGYGLWQRHFGADPGVIGKTITLEKTTLTVIGILPESFKGQSGVVDVWAPMMMVPVMMSPGRLNQPFAHWHEVIARLKPGVNQSQAQAAMPVVAKKIMESLTKRAGATPDELVIAPLGDAYLDPTIKSSLLILLGAVGFVLLIACVNIANLLMARAAKRQKEIAVRLALGASRGTLIRQLLTESVLLAIIGGSAGLFVAKIGTSLLALVKPTSNPAFRAKDIQTLNFSAAHLDIQVLAFNFGLAVATGLLFGLIPAFQASRSDVTEALKDSRTSAGHRSSILRQINSRNVLVVAEIALSLVLLTCAGLMIRSFMRLQSSPAGFNADNLLTLKIDLPRSYSPYNEAAFNQQLINRTEALPGVSSASVATATPLSSAISRTTMDIQDWMLPSGAERPLVGLLSVGPDYFKTLRIPLISGRSFDNHDNANSQSVAIINETAVKQFWPSENPLGKRIRLGIGRGPTDDWTEIVGIAGDVKYGKVDEAVTPDIYVCYLQPTEYAPFLIVRTATDPVSIVSAIRQTVLSLDRDLPVYDVMTMHERVAEATSRTRFSAVLLGIFASLALILSAIGIYGVMSFVVSGQTREIGIRMALGAQQVQVLRTFLSEGLAITFAGVVIGIAAALLSTRLLESQLFGIGKTDP
ncbi:MAG TPA: ABC transporter permease, partial [Blastocatellia bacterium]|nr:ABC transporter permease [Blastocatellia bacterium]